MTHIKLQILKLINNFVLNAWLIIYFLELHHTCEIYIFERVTQLVTSPTDSATVTFYQLSVHVFFVNTAVSKLLAIFVR
jgi:hypothetical protein